MPVYVRIPVKQALNRSILRQISVKPVESVEVGSRVWDPARRPTDQRVGVPAPRGRRRASSFLTEITLSAKGAQKADSAYEETLLKALYGLEDPPKAGTHSPKRGPCFSGSGRVKGAVSRGLVLKMSAFWNLSCKTHKIVKSLEAARGPLEPWALQA